LLTAALAAAPLGLAACSDDGGNRAANGAGEVNAATAGTDGNAAAGGATGASAGSSFPQGARIVEENGVTYRVDPDGTRVRLESTDSRIVVENGVRYRVDPDGTRMRIDERGAAIDLPDVDIGINNKGNLDVDVGDRDPDGGR
ncbi:MAG: hypothetical protein M3N07_05530, partial [Pseudomonadota bacterium]|nr:hypothetical protein [Pseudomonadota bacterium]